MTPPTGPGHPLAASDRPVRAADPSRDPTAGPPADAPGAVAPPLPPGPPPVPALGGGWSLRPAAADGGDLDTVHRWMNAPRVARRWAQDWPRERWHAELARHLAGDHCVPCLAGRGDREVAYLELYWAARDPLAPYLAA